MKALDFQVLNEFTEWVKIFTNLIKSVQNKIMLGKDGRMYFKWEPG
jgi:hypothetical protein